MKFKIALLSLIISFLSLSGMNPGKTDKVRRYNKVLKKLSAQDKSKYKFYQNSIPDIQRVIQYQAYAQAIYLAKSSDALLELLTQIKELKEQYNDSQIQQAQHPYSFAELEKLGKAELLVQAADKIKHYYEYSYVKQLTQLTSNEETAHAFERVANSLMHYAVNYNNTDLIKVAAYCGANMNYYPRDPNFPYLHDGQLKAKTVETLLDLGADINYRITQFTPLHTHINFNKFDIAELLIKRGANVHGIKYCTSPLMSAAAFKNNNLVKMLLEAGADVTPFEYFFSISSELREMIDNYDREKIAKYQKLN